MFNQDKISEDEVRKTKPAERCATFFDRGGKHRQQIAKNLVDWSHNLGINVVSRRRLSSRRSSKGFHRTLFNIGQHQSTEKGKGRRNSRNVGKNQPKETNKKKITKDEIVIVKNRPGILQDHQSRVAHQLTKSDMRTKTIAVHWRRSRSMQSKTTIGFGKDNNNIMTYQPSFGSRNGHSFFVPQVNRQPSSQTDSVPKARGD
ncbi:unnamed protein product [Caenorhabditis brenneri]